MEKSEEGYTGSFLSILPQLDWGIVDTGNGYRIFIGHRISYIDGKEVVERVFRDEMQEKSVISGKGHFFKRLKLWWKVLFAYGRETR